MARAKIAAMDSPATPGAAIVASTVAANGVTMRLRRAGAGEPLNLLHGWPEWSYVWEPVMARLAGRHALVAPDFRGFGDSEKTSSGPAKDAGPDALASDILALADTLGLARFGLVSHDVGSFVAQAIARRAPERLSGLFFFNCAHPGIGRRVLEPRHLPEVWYQFFHQQTFAAALVGSSREACGLYLRHFLGHWSHGSPTFDDAALEAWVDNFMKPGNLQGGFNWYASVHDARMAMVEGTAKPPPPIAVPTRVLWGALDPVLKVEWIDRLPEFFTDLEAGVEPDAGHFVHWERPDRAAAAIAAFFGRLRR